MADEQMVFRSAGRRRPVVGSISSDEQVTVHGPGGTEVLAGNGWIDGWETVGLLCAWLGDPDGLSTACRPVRAFGTMGRCASSPGTSTPPSRMPRMRVWLQVETGCPRLQETKIADEQFPAMRNPGTGI